MLLERYSIATILCLRVESTCRDPNDGELCLNKVKPEESLLEICSDSEMQLNWSSSIYAHRYVSSWLNTPIASYLVYDSIVIETTYCYLATYNKLSYGCMFKLMISWLLSMYICKCIALLLETWNYVRTDTNIKK